MNYQNAVILATVAAVVAFGLQTAAAQNMAHTVVNKEIKFARGKSAATVSGTAKYAMSYVFDLRARAGQTMELELKGRNPHLTFSLIAPDAETIEDAFGVKDWSGTLPQSGRYSIVVVMNDVAAAGVPYSVKIK